MESAPGLLLKYSTKTRLRWGEGGNGRHQKCRAYFLSDVIVSKTYSRKITTCLKFIKCCAASRLRLALCFKLANSDLSLYAWASFFINIWSRSGTKRCLDFSATQTATPARVRYCSIACYGVINEYNLFSSRFLLSSRSY